MPRIHEQLASALSSLKALQDSGRRVFRSDEFSRAELTRLEKSGFLQRVIRGWYVSSSPLADGGDSTPWYASFWEFCSRYCESRFGQDWCLAPELSLLLHADVTSVPRQVVVYSPSASNNCTDLPYNTSLFDSKTPSLPPPADMAYRDGLRVYSVAAALVKVPESFFKRYPVEALALLTSLADRAGVVRHLLEGEFHSAAGRLAGAFRRAGQNDTADQILRTMRTAGYLVSETDPFAEEVGIGRLTVVNSPLMARLEAMWLGARNHILELFPEAPGLPKDPRRFMRFVEDAYTTDSYHSLSIEGFSVTPELIERVRTGKWDPDGDERAARDRDVLAARGYWQAFQKVKQSVSQMVARTAGPELVRAAHQEWHFELFAPCVAVGLYPAAGLAGYRNNPVYIKGSRYVPPRWESVPDGMRRLFDLLEQEPEPCVRAVLAHWLFGYIHPYSDGNGRLARFLMNAMLATGGYPWTVVRVEQRKRYLEALDAASLEQDIVPFAGLMAEAVELAMSSENWAGCAKAKKR